MTEPLPGNLIDDTERTQWTAEGTITGGNLSVDGRKVTIDLAGTEPVRIDRLQVSAHLAAGQNRFTALRQFEVWACNNGGDAQALSRRPACRLLAGQRVSQGVHEPCERLPRQIRRGRSRRT